MKRTILIFIFFFFVCSWMYILNAQDVVFDIKTINVYKTANTVFRISQFMTVFAMTLTIALTVASNLEKTEKKSKNKTMLVFIRNLSMLTAAFGIMTLVLSITNYCLKFSNETKDVVLSSVIFLITVLLAIHSQKHICQK